ncbi:Zinc induced facilitator-like, partial [Thalictrum thalictroides]
MVTGERQAARIRGMYLKSILKQDIAFFDTKTTTEDVIGRMSQDTILIQDAKGEKVGNTIQLFSTFYYCFMIAIFKGWLLALVLVSCIHFLVADIKAMSISKLASRRHIKGNILEQTIRSIRTIRDTHIGKNEEDIGYYAGFVGASFMFGRSLTSVLWGVIADRYGRKPMILICTVSMLGPVEQLFGLSTRFWMAVVTRFLLGCINGLLGTIKAYASEVSREEHQTLALSLVSTAWGIALIVGPALGGFLAQ